MTRITDERLPKLPKPAGFNYAHGADLGWPYYTEDQMKAYASAALRSQPAGVRVKGLEWEMFWKQDEGRREVAKTALGETYHVSDEGWWFPLWTLNKCDGIEAAKAAAEADYRQRILSALEPQQEEKR